MGVSFWCGKRLCQNRVCTNFYNHLMKEGNCMLGKYLKQVRTKAPLIHNITNYVTVNDVANVLLACGGSPIMEQRRA